MAPRPPPAWMVRLNIALLRRGVTIGSQHLLTAPGRRTGEPRSTPISIATVAGSRYIVAAFADAAWVKNIRAAGTATLTRGTRTERIGLDEVPVEQRGPVLRAFLEQVRGGRRFFSSRSADEVVEAAADYPVFRITEPPGIGPP